MLVQRLVLEGDIEKTKTIYQIEHKLLKPKYFYKQNRRDEFAINLVS